MTDYGTVVHRGGERAVLRFTRRLPHPPERVWAALTDPAELPGWWGDVRLEPRAGGAVTVRRSDTDDGGVPHGTITGWRPPSLWEMNTDLHGVLRWALTAVDGGTELEFVTDGTVTDERLPSSLADWHVHLELLERTLDGHGVDRADRWRDLSGRYRVQSLYQHVITAWNDRSGAAFAEPFAPDADVFGWDGTHHRGADRLAADLQGIFDQHPTGRYVTVVKDIRPVGADGMLLSALAGLVPPGQDTVRAETNAWQTVVAERRGEDWVILQLQNTPTRYPDVARELDEAAGYRVGVVS